MKYYLTMMTRGLSDPPTTFVFNNPNPEYAPMVLAYDDDGTRFYALYQWVESENEDGDVEGEWQKLLHRDLQTMCPEWDQGQYFPTERFVSWSKVPPSSNNTPKDGDDQIT